MWFYRKWRSFSDLESNFWLEKGFKCSHGSIFYRFYNWNIHFSIRTLSLLSLNMCHYIQNSGKQTPFASAFYGWKAWWTCHQFYCVRSEIAYWLINANTSICQPPFSFGRMKRKQNRNVFISNVACKYNRNQRKGAIEEHVCVRLPLSHKVLLRVKLGLLFYRWTGGCEIIMEYLQIFVVLMCVLNGLTIQGMLALN